MVPACEDFFRPHQNVSRELTSRPIIELRLIGRREEVFGLVGQ